MSEENIIDFIRLSAETKYEQYIKQSENIEKRALIHLETSKRLTAYALQLKQLALNLTIKDGGHNANND